MSVAVNIRPTQVNQVEQGRSFDFEYALEGSGQDAFTVTYAVLQYPGLTPALTGTMTLDNLLQVFTARLTAAETDTLAVGQWFIHINAVSASENIEELIKLYVRKKWV